MWQSKCRTVQGPQGPISPGSSRPFFPSPPAPGTDDGACTELTLVSTGPSSQKTCCSVAGVRVPMNHPFLTDTPPGPQMQCVGAGPSPQSPPTYDAHPCSTISDAAGSTRLFASCKSQPLEIGADVATCLHLQQSPSPALAGQLRPTTWKSKTSDVLYFCSISFASLSFALL